MIMYYPVIIEINVIICCKTVFCCCCFFHTHSRILEVDNWHTHKQKYDFISCLNVLDRCDSSLSMLSTIHNKLNQGGILLLALVMPYDPFVEKGTSKIPPTEYLPISSEGWEEGVSTLWSNILQPMGFTPVAISRVPYLCEGDMNCDCYSLDDALLVLRKT